MTCIVGLTHKGRAYVGGDSMALHGTVPKMMATGKVWRCGEFIMGGAGTARANELVRHNFKPPPIRHKGSQPERLDRYMNSSFASALRKLLEAYNCIGEDEENQVEDCGSSFIIGVRGQLYLMDNSFAVYRTDEIFNATGSGHEVAMGALHALKVSGLIDNPEQALTIALEAAEKWQDCVRGPFHIISER